MSLFISHTSALQYWYLHGRTLNDKGDHRNRRKPPDTPPDTLEFLKKSVWGLSLPIDVIANEPKARRKSKVARPHVFKGPFPRDCFIDVGGELYVSSPEFCFFQLATKLSLIELIELGFELCGSYSLPRNTTTNKDNAPDKGKAPNENCDMNPNANTDSSQKTLFNRTPLSSIKKLLMFTLHMEGVHGRSRALQALRYIVENSASPMETTLVMLLTLPYKLGGYGFPYPKLNSRITPAKAAKGSANKAFYSCDLFWPDKALAVEYDSDAYHTGPERIASDSKRRNSLTSMGIQVITVTNQQIRNTEEFNKVAKQLATGLEKRLQFKNPGFTEARNALRSALLSADG